MENSENQIAERINDIQKIEFKLHQVFKSRTNALLIVKPSVNAYNSLRPHINCNYMTLVKTQVTIMPLAKPWKNRRKRMIAAMMKQLSV